MKQALRVLFLAGFIFVPFLMTAYAPNPYVMGICAFDIFGCLWAATSESKRLRG